MRTISEFSSAAAAAARRAAHCSPSCRRFASAFSRSSCSFRAAAARFASTCTRFSAISSSCALRSFAARSFARSDTSGSVAVNGRRGERTGGDVGLPLWDGESTGFDRPARAGSGARGVSGSGDTSIAAARARSRSATSWRSRRKSCAMGLVKPV